MIGRFMPVKALKLQGLGLKGGESARECSHSKQAVRQAKRENSHSPVIWKPTAPEPAAVAAAAAAG